MADDEKEIDKGIEQVKRILAENYVRNDEVNLIKSRIRDNETYNVIDVVDARFNERLDNIHPCFYSLINQQLCNI